MFLEQPFPQIKGGNGNLIFVTQFLDFAGMDIIIPQNS
jgi:hypothetical protein